MVNDRDPRCGLVGHLGHVGALHPFFRERQRIEIPGRQGARRLDADRHPRIFDDGEHLSDAGVDIAHQVPHGGDPVRAERQFACGGGLQAHLVLQAGREDAVARAEFEGVWIEQIVRHVEQAQTLGAGARPLGSGQHQVEDVLGGIAHIATGDESLHALDVPGAVGLGDGLGTARADIGAGVRLGQHHGRRPAPLQAHCGPTLLLFVALDVERVGHRRAQCVPEGCRRIGAHQHLVDRPRQRRGRGNTADFLGDADAPPFGVLDRLHRFRQFAGHADGVAIRVEDRRVAVGSGERLGHRTLRQSGDLVEHRAHRVDVEIAVAARSENVAEIQHLEQVEFDVTDIGDVVPQRISLRLANWRKVWRSRENVRNRNQVQPTVTEP